MNRSIKKLGDAELEIMRVLWESEEPVTSGYVLEKLKGKRDWKLSTLMTTLSRLGSKGFVNCDRTTRTNYYTPIISELDYKGIASKNLFEKLYGNSIKNMVASLYDSHSIGDNDLKELRSLIDELEKEHRDG